MILFFKENKSCKARARRFDTAYVVATYTVAIQSSGFQDTAQNFNGTFGERRIVCI